MTDLLELPALGVAVTPMRSDDVISELDTACAQHRTFVIGAHNLHSVYLAQRDADFAAFCRRCDLCLADGMPVLLACRQARPRQYSTDYRIGSTDWIPRLASAQHVRRIALIGSTPLSNDLAVARLQEMCPDAQVMGLPGHDWNDARADLTTKWLHLTRPDVVLIGLGMPLQERYLTEHLHLLPPAVYATVGGAVDQLAGVQRNAPRWLGRVGLEWAWRLALQPRRLAHRYMVEPMLLAWILAGRARHRTVTRADRP